jgi:hypothetical protein
VITGGEPFCHGRRLLQILRLCKKHGMKIRISTNGSYPKNIFDTLKELRIDLLSLSIDTTHLKFIPYTEILWVLKRFITSGQRISIVVTYSRKRLRDEIKLIKKFSREVNGRLVLPPYYKLKKTFLGWIKTKKQKVPVIFRTIHPTKWNIKVTDSEKADPSHLFFLYCPSPNFTLDWRGRLLFCCSPSSIDKPAWYKVEIENGRVGYENELLRFIAEDRFAFIRIFTYLWKQKRATLRKILQKDCYNLCDLCEQLLERSKKGDLRISTIKDTPIYGTLFTFFPLFLKAFFLLILLSVLWRLRKQLKL